MKRIFLLKAPTIEHIKIGKSLFILLLAVMITLLASCDNTVPDLKETTNDNITNSYNTNNSIYYPDFFNKKISENPIDLLFQHSFDKGEKNYSEIVSEYNENWRNEFQQTKNDLKIVFREKEVDCLLENLEDWENNLKAFCAWETENVFSQERSKYGTQTFDDELKKIGDNYRDKTIQLKYMMFLQETDMDPSNFTDDLLSIKFIHTNK